MRLLHQKHESPNATFSRKQASSLCTTEIRAIHTLSFGQTLTSAQLGGEPEKRRFSSKQGCSRAFFVTAPIRNRYARSTSTHPSHTVLNHGIHGDPVCRGPKAALGDRRDASFSSVLVAWAYAKAASVSRGDASAQGSRNRVTPGNADLGPQTRCFAFGSPIPIGL
jgi:hypothetical protein